MEFFFFHLDSKDKEGIAWDRIIIFISLRGGENNKKKIEMNYTRIGNCKRNENDFQEF